MGLIGWVCPDRVPGADGSPMADTGVRDAPTPRLSCRGLEIERLEIERLEIERLEIERLSPIAYRRGRPRTRSAMMLRWISEVPPAMVPAKD
jgi:hypothetical protein